MCYPLAIYYLPCKTHFSWIIYPWQLVDVYQIIFLITKSTSIRVCTPCHFLLHWLDTILSNSKPSLLCSLFSSTYKHAKHINILKPFPCFHILSYLLLHFPPNLSESKIPWKNRSPLLSIFIFYSFLNKHQSGFLSKKSTRTALEKHCEIC